MAEKIEPLKPYYPDQCCGSGYCIDELGIHKETYLRVEAVTKFLEKREREIRAEVWDECCEESHVCECAQGPHVQHPPNPYR